MFQFIVAKRGLASFTSLFLGTDPILTFDTKVFYLFLLPLLSIFLFGSFFNLVICCVLFLCVCLLLAFTVVFLLIAGPSGRAV
jgi:hypothetical protein